MVRVEDNTQEIRNRERQRKQNRRTWYHERQEMKLFQEVGG